MAQKIVPSLWQGAGVVWEHSTIYPGEESELAITQAGARLINLPPDPLTLISVKIFGLNSKTLFVLSVPEHI